MQSEIAVREMLNISDIEDSGTLKPENACNPENPLQTMCLEDVNPVNTASCPVTSNPVVKPAILSTVFWMMSLRWKKAQFQVYNQQQ